MRRLKEEVGDKCRRRGRGCLRGFVLGQKCSPSMVRASISGSDGSDGSRSSEFPESWHLAGDGLLEALHVRKESLQSAESWLSNMLCEMTDLKISVFIHSTTSYSNYLNTSTYSLEISLLFVGKDQNISLT